MSLFESETGCIWRAFNTENYRAFGFKAHCEQISALKKTVIIWMVRWVEVGEL